MPSIFISYRRADSDEAAGRIYDHLKNEFGAEQIFKDVYSIGAGSDFRVAIVEAIDSCQAVLAIIGDRWLSATDEIGQRRLDSADDYVRIEIEEGLQRNKLVIPVLIRRAQPPDREKLPPSLQPLAYRNAIRVRPDPDFGDDIGRLLGILREVIPRPAKQLPGPATGRSPFAPGRRRIFVSLAVAALLLAGGVTMYKVGWLHWRPAEIGAPTGEAQSPPASTPLPEQLRRPRWQQTALPFDSQPSTMYFVNASRGWAAWGDGRLSRSDDGGQTWELQQFNAGEAIADIFFRNDAYGWLLTPSGLLYSTVDGGVTWRSSQLPQGGTYRFARFFDDRRGLALAQQDSTLLAYHTLDAGKNWLPSKVPADFPVMKLADMFTALPSNAWVAPWGGGGFKHGGLLTTSDGGQSWTVQDTSNVYYMTGVSFLDTEIGWSIGYVFGNSFGSSSCGDFTTVVLRTQAGGASWEPIGTGICGFSGGIDFVDPKHGSMVVNQQDVSSILMTADGGETWPTRYDPKVAISSLGMVDNSFGWALGQGAMFYYRK